MSKKPKYPWSLFFIGFLMNLIKHFYLLLPSIVLLLVGIWVDWALIVGTVLAIANVTISLIEQIQIRHTTLHSDNPNFKKWQDAILSDNWQKNMGELLGEKVSEEANFVNLDNDALLTKCNGVLSKINEELLTYYREKSSDLFDEILSKTDNTDEYIISDFVNTVIPDLEYIKESLEKDFIINKRKIKYYSAIKDKWNKDISIYSELMDLYNAITD